MSQPEAPFRPEVVAGQRIFLSHVQREDVPDFARWFADLELTAYLGPIGTSYTPEQEDHWYNDVASDMHNKTFAIIVRDGTRLIGSCGLRDINYRHGTAELGIAIGEKRAWGRGYGSEAVRLLCDYGFTFLNLHNIRLWHVAFNARGHHAYLKAGFQESGRVRGAISFNGNRYDNILMDITRADFGASSLAGMIGQLAQEGEDATR